MEYVPALDGIRGVAILLVTASHVGPTAIGGGGDVGVDLFFVLSGFLITSILIVERKKTNQISIKSFYKRRIFRIWPVFIAVVAVYIAVMTLTSGAFDNHAIAAAISILSIMNWAQALSFGQVGFLGGTWSLSIEEQFYLLWPLTLGWLLCRATDYDAGKLVVGFLLAFMAWRWFLVFGGANALRIYCGTDTHADPILAGCALALLRPNWRIAASVNRLAWGALVLLCAVPSSAPSWLSTEFSLTALCGTCVVWCAVNNPEAAILSSKSAVWLGKRSYGLYLWQGPILGVFRHVPGNSFLKGVAEVSIGICLAHFSYEYIELVFMRLRKRMSKTTTSEVSV